MQRNASLPDARKMHAGKMQSDASPHNAGEMHARKMQGDASPYNAGPYNARELYASMCHAGSMPRKREGSCSAYEMSEYGNKSRVCEVP